MIQYTTVVKIATPIRGHVTEMKYTTDQVHGNRQMIRITELYMVCEHVISIWREASMHCNQSLYASWHGIKEALDIFLGNVPPCSLYVCPQSIKSRCWRTLTNNSPINLIPDMFDGQHVQQMCRQGSSDTRHLWMKACTILAMCGRALSC